MRQLTVGFIFGLAFLALGAQANPSTVLSPVEKVFVPNGFDDNDNVEIILHGMFANTCFKTGDTGYHLNPANNEITVWAHAYEYPQENTFCAQMRVPFLQQVKVGFLKEGRYKVKLLHESHVATEFSVSRSTVSSPDEYLYAPVQQVHVSQTEGAKSAAVKVEGVFPRLFDGCMKMQEVRVIGDSPEIMVVLPIAAVEYDEACNEYKHEFSVEVAADLNISPYSLVHTRVTNGNSLNQLYIDEK